ncbi:hypothetical protein [Phormidium nigroviride]|uniref:hypothetical protein n=1 Tax=Phormidium nigroviride TaxID=482564 RepID=UPI00167F1F2E|nr:hypothetical protein [Oscillatoria nigro-viridis]
MPKRVNCTNRLKPYLLPVLELLGFGKCDRAKPLSRDPGKIGHDVKKCNENAKTLTTQEF